MTKAAAKGDGAAPPRKRPSAKKATPARKGGKAKKAAHEPSTISNGALNALPAVTLSKTKRPASTLEPTTSPGGAEAPPPLKRAKLVSASTSKASLAPNGNTSVSGVENAPTLTPTELPPTFTSQYLWQQSVEDPSFINRAIAGYGFDNVQEVLAGMQATKRADVLSHIIASIDLSEGKIEEDIRFLSQIRTMAVDMIRTTVYPNLFAYDAHHSPCDKVDTMLLFNEEFWKTQGDHLFSPNDREAIKVMEIRIAEQGPVWGRKIGAKEAGRALRMCVLPFVKSMGLGMGFARKVLMMCLEALGKVDEEEMARYQILKEEKKTADGTMKGQLAGFQCDGAADDDIEHQGRPSKKPRILGPDVHDVEMRMQADPQAQPASMKETKESQCELETLDADEFAAKVEAALGRSLSPGFMDFGQILAVETAAVTPKEDAVIRTAAIDTSANVEPDVPAADFSKDKKPTESKLSEVHADSSLDAAALQQEDTEMAGAQTDPTNVPGIPDPQELVEELDAIEHIADANAEDTTQHQQQHNISNPTAATGAPAPPHRVSKRPAEDEAGPDVLRIKVPRIGDVNALTGAYIKYCESMGKDTKVVRLKYKGGKNNGVDDRWKSSHEVRVKQHDVDGSTSEWKEPGKWEFVEGKLGEEGVE